MLNISHFVDTLPEQFNKWLPSERKDYFQKYLDGFMSFSNTTQDWISRYLTESRLQYLVQSSLGSSNGSHETKSFTDIINGLSFSSLWDQFTRQPNSCLKHMETERTYMLYALIPAIMVLFVLSFMETRAKMCVRCCWRKPGIVMAMNFMDERHFRWAFAAVFVLLEYPMIFLIFRRWYVVTPPGYQDTAEWNAAYGWCMTFVGLVNVLHMSVVYYPLAACLTMRRFLIPNFLGLAHLAPLMYMRIVIIINCPPDKNDEGDMSMEGVTGLISEIPLLVCFLVLIVAYSYNIAAFFYALCSKEKTIEGGCCKLCGARKENCMGKPSVAIIYLESLLQRRPQPKPKSWKEVLKMHMTYHVIRGFYYSPRLVCTLAAAAYALYQMCSSFAVLTEVFFRYLQMMVELPGIKDLIRIINNEIQVQLGFNLNLHRNLADAVGIARYCLLFGNYGAVGLQIAFMIHMIFTYRKHMIKYFKGNKRWHYKNNSAAFNQLAVGMRYSGFQIVFILHGYFMVMLTLAPSLFFVLYFIIFPIGYGETNIIIDKMLQLWPTLVISVILWFTPFFLAKWLFLQENGNVGMALTNRKLFHIISYFLFFGNCLLGVLAAIKRLLVAVALNTILMSRIDACLLMRGFEQFDTAFSSYLGMLETELYHSHPLLKAAVEKLWAGIDKQPHYYNGNIKEVDKGGRVGRSVESHRAKLRWLKAVTLVNNPSIVLVIWQKRLNKLQKEWTEALASSTDKTAAMEIINKAKYTLNNNQLRSAEEGDTTSTGTSNGVIVSMPNPVSLPEANGKTRTHSYVNRGTDEGEVDDVTTKL